MGHTKRLQEGSLNPADIIFGAKSIISGMFRQNKEDTQIDDSYFMPMLRMCLKTLTENSRKAGLPKSEVKAMHDALYQHSLNEYVKEWLQNAREDSPDCDEEEEIEEATESFVAFYEGDKN
jgi:hypothetical protein